MSKPSQETNKRRRYIKVAILSVLSLIVLAIAAFTFILLYRGSTRHIESIANQLKVDKDWQMVTSQTEPPRIVCLGDNPCPSVHRAWKTDATINRTQLEGIIKSSGWTDFIIKDDCSPKKNVYGSTTICGASGSRDGFSVEVSVEGNASASDDNRMTLFIKPE